jgi:DNA-directed RNA polymerase II subunit RPB1
MTSQVYARVKALQFGVLSPEAIRDMAVVSIEHEEALDSGKIRDHGLLDYRMGPLDKELKCQSCGSKIANCVGHFGRLELDNKPMYHIGFIENVVDILKCICFHCSRLLCNKQSKHFKKIQRIQDNEMRIKALLSFCKNQAECSFPVKNGNDGCRKEQPSLRIIDNVKIEVQFSRVFPEFSDKAKFYLEPEVAIKILKRIDVEDYHVIGCDEQLVRPHWMIISVLPVPPPIVRPSNISNGAARGEDDLTYKLSDIVRTRNTLRSKLKGKNAQAQDIRACRHMIQLYGASYFDNNSVGHQHIMQRMGRPQKGIRQRLRGKEGRVRGSLMGKRDDFTARTVITPDPNLSVCEVGVPYSIARNVTYSEYVNKLNIERLTKTVLNGPDSQNGAKAVLLQDGFTKLDLMKIDNRDKIVLQEGMRVVRHMKDGDLVIMNRQPSLHKLSMQGHIARIMPYSTFRLPLTVCTPYNAGTQ